MRKKDKSNGRNIYVIAFIENINDELKNESLIKLVRETALKGKYSDEHFDLNIYPTILDTTNQNYFNIVKRATHYDNLLYYDPITELKVNAFIFNQYHWDRMG